MEGAVVHNRLKHRLYETDMGWELRPIEGLWRNDRRFLVGFGVPFLVLSASLAGQTSVAAAVLAALCVGSALLIIGAIHRASYDRLTKLRIPANGEELDFDGSDLPDLTYGSLGEALKFYFGPAGRDPPQRIQIPRDLIAAVQLCPWKYSSGDTDAWAVQGLLVLRSLTDGVYHQLPLFLTIECVGAARLMRRLADVLRVPYLFYADAAGWKEEAMRARSRPPLRAGGSMT